MHIAHQKMHIAIESLLPLTYDLIRIVEEMGRDDRGMIIAMVK